MAALMAAAAAHGLGDYRLRVQRLLGRRHHATDWGLEPLLDTIDLLRANGIQAIGAERNLAEAGQPALIAIRR